MLRAIKFDYCVIFFGVVIILNIERCIAMPVHEYLVMPTDIPLDAETPHLRSGSRPGSATKTHSCGHIRGVPSVLRTAQHMKPFGLTSWYQKYTEAYGIPVVSSNAVSNEALQRACYILRHSLADRADVRNAYYKSHGRVAIIGVNEYTTQIPEHAFLPSWWNQRARGLGATVDRPISTGGEENALCMSHDRYREDIVLHEYSHGLHVLGARFGISNFDSRLQGLYNSARARGLWANTYALSTYLEYFAEGVQSYFNAEAYANPPDGIHNHVNTRDKLKDYDRALHDLIAEVFPCNNAFIKRCARDRNGELNQVLQMDCSSGGGGGGGGGGGDDCTDDDQYCAAWASSGWCTRGNAHVDNKCKKSCNTCDGGGGGGGNCQDDNQHCSAWSRNGECSKNPDYMRVSCKKSCSVC